MFWRVSILLILGIFNLALFGRMIWGPTGLMEYRDLKQQHTALLAEISSLDAQNRALSKDIRLLQSDGQYVEKMISQRLHYMRDNEVLYLFGSSAQPSPGAPAHDGKD